MRKNFIPFVEFAGLMRMAGLNELLFLHQAQLGMYTVREWKRHSEAPYWAGEFCRMQAELNVLRAVNPGVDTTPKVEMDPVLLHMTEKEMLHYGTIPDKNEMIKFYESIKARMLSNTHVETKAEDSFGAGKPVDDMFR